jgi:hypothetical protein
VIQYKRKDGVALSGTYLPGTIKKKEKLPLLIYPAEFKTKLSRAK